MHPYSNRKDIVLSTQEDFLKSHADGILVKHDVWHILKQEYRPILAIIAFIIANLVITVDLIKNPSLITPIVILMNAVILHRIIEFVRTRIVAIRTMSFETVPQTFDIYDIQLISESTHKKRIHYVKFSMIGKFDNEWYVFNDRSIRNTQMVANGLIFADSLTHTLSIPIGQYGSTYYIFYENIVDAIQLR